MVKKDKIRQVRKVLGSYSKVTYNNLKKIVVEKKGLMAAQTFSDALKEGVETGVITRDEGHYGKRPVVWYSKPENAKLEKDYYQELVNSVDSFTERLNFFKEKFPKLNNTEKGQVLFSFIDWLYVIHAKTGMGQLLFNSSKFSDLFQSMVPSLQELDKLSLSGDKKLQSIIWDELFMGWNDVEQDNLEEIDELLGIPKTNKK